MPDRSEPAVLSRHPCRNGALHFEARRRLSVLMTLPHHGIGAFKIARKSLRIEKRIGLPIARELLFDSEKRTGIARQLQGEGFVIAERMGDQFRQPNSLEQACRDSPCKTIAGTGQRGKPSPKRIARRRVCVARKRIEMQIRQAMACKVLF